MIENDRQLGWPFREYRDTKANIEGLALGGADEGCVAYATDTDEFGTFDGAAWVWITDHNQLNNLQGGTPGEYYHFTQAQHTSFTVVGEVGSVLVCTGVNVWGADLTPLWMGTHTWGSGFAVKPTDATGQDLGDATHRWDLHTQIVSFENLTTGNNSIVIPDGLADALHIVDTGATEFLRLDTDNDYYLIDPAVAGIKVGIGTPTPLSRFNLEAPNATLGTHYFVISTDADDYPVIQQGMYTHDNAWIAFDSYLDGAGAWKSSDLGSNFLVNKAGDLFKIMYDSGIAAGANVTWENGIILTSVGKVGIRTADPWGMRLGIEVEDGLPATSGNVQTEGVRLRAGGDYVMDLGLDGTGGAGWIQVGNKANLAAGFCKPLLLNPVGGNVGVGCNPTSGRLQVAGGATTALRLDANAGVAAINIGGTGEIIVDAPGVGGGRFVVKDTGRVGIGTPTPGATVEILSATVQLFLTNNAAVRTTLAATAAGNLLVIPTGGTMYLWDNAQAFKITLYNAGVDAVHLDANGDSWFKGGQLGIGKTPAVELDVAGSIRLDGDEGGLANTVTLTDVEVTSNFNLATAIKIYVGTTAYCLLCYEIA